MTHGGHRDTCQRCFLSWRGRHRKMCQFLYSIDEVFAEAYIEIKREGKQFPQNFCFHIPPAPSYTPLRSVYRKEMQWRHSFDANITRNFVTLARSVHFNVNFKGNQTNNKYAVRSGLCSMAMLQTRTLVFGKKGPKKLKNKTTKLKMRTIDKP